MPVLVGCPTTVTRWHQGYNLLATSKIFSQVVCHVITAAQGNQFAGALPEGNRPAFSYIMLGALRGWGDRNEDQQVTLHEALDYSQRFLQETVVGRTQTPQQILGDKDIVLTTNGSSKPPDAHQL